MQSMASGGMRLHLARVVPSAFQVLYLSLIVCLLALRPSPATHKALAWTSWVLKLLQGLCLGLLPGSGHTRLLFKHGLGYVLAIADMLLHQVVTRSIPLRARLLLCAAHAYLFSHAAYQVSALGSASFLQTVVLAQLSFIVPVLLLERCFSQWAPAAQPAPAPAGTSAGAAGTSTNPVVTDSASSLASPKPGLKNMILPSLEVLAAASGAHAAATEEPLSGATPRGRQAAAAGRARQVAAVARGRSFRLFSREERKASQRSIAELVNQLRGHDYRPALGLSTKVCVKLDTLLPCEALPANMPQQMQGALNNLGLHISQVAVRQGCIMLTLDVHQAASTTSTGGAASATADSPIAHYLMEAGAQQLAQRVLDTVLHALEGLPAEDLVCPPRPSVKQAMLQVGSVLFAATWNTSQNTWDLHSMGSCMYTAQPLCSSLSGREEEPARLGIAQVLSVHSQQLLRPADALHPTGKVADRPAAQIELALEVQVWDLAPAQTLQGWCPPPPGHHAAGHTWGAQGVGAARWSRTGGMKLLARCGGVYLRTQVQRVQHGGWTTPCHTAEVVVDVPVEVLTTHHTGGPASTVLLLNLELWRGEVFISDTPIVMLPPAALTQTTATTAAASDGAAQVAATAPAPSAAPRATSAASAAAGAAREVSQQVLSSWWWGAQDAQVAAAAADLQALTEAALAVEATGTHISGWIDFMKDLAYWLACVRQQAHGSGFCVCTPATGPHHAGISSSLPPHGSCLHSLSEHLVHYARSLGLNGVGDMVAAQAQQLLGQQPAAAAAVSEQGLSLARQLATAVSGFPCRQCEQQYRAQAWSFQAMASAGLVLMSGLTHLRAILRGDWQFVPIILPWGICHVANTLRVLRNGCTAGQPWSAYSYLHRIALQWAWVLGVLPLQRSLVLFNVVVLRMLTHLTFALSEQAQAGRLLPPRLLFLVAVLLDLPSVMGRAWREHSQPLYILALQVLLAPFVVVLPRLLMDSHLRAAFIRRRGPHSNPAGKQHTRSWASALTGSSAAKQQHGKYE